MSYNATLRADIAAAIHTPADPPITGAELQAQLLAIVDAISAGGVFLGTVATDTVPGTTTNGFYLATTVGTYTNFIDTSAKPIVIAEGEIALLSTIEQNGIIRWAKNPLPGRGEAAYLHIMYAANHPSQNSDMHDTFASGDKWIGICADANETAPTDYHLYQWAKFVGDNGQDGAPGHNPNRGTFEIDTTSEPAITYPDGAPSAGNIDGDYIIVIDNGTSTAKIWLWDVKKSLWVATAMDANDAYFHSGELLIDTDIINDLNGSKPNRHGVLSAELGKILANSLLIKREVSGTYTKNFINAQLQWETATNVSLQIKTNPGYGYIVEYVSGDTDSELTNWNFLNNWYNAEQGTDASNYFVDGHPMTTFYSKGSFDTGIIPEGCEYLYVRAKIGGIDINPNQYKITEYFIGKFSDLENEISDLENEISDFKNPTKDLFLGTLLQKGYSASGLTEDNPKRVVMRSVIALPYVDVSIQVKLPQYIYASIRLGSIPNNLNTHRYYFSDGSTIATESKLFYRIQFLKSTTYVGSGTFVDEEISVEEINNMISNGEISFKYLDDSDIIKDNLENEKYVKSATREFYSKASLNNTLPNLPVFTHLTDIHGDAVRFERFLAYSDYLGVDAALISGDFAAANPSNSCQFINDISDLHTTMVLPCTGNHDTELLTTNQEVNEQVMGYLINKNNVVVNPAQGDYPTYYYKDLDSKQLRIISLDLHEGARQQLDGCNFTQAQCEWFINALASTPAGYGVLVMYHEPERAIIKETPYDAFYQPITTTLIFQLGITGCPISSIIDSFIARNQATISYTSQGVNITVSTDFTNVASGVEFIAHVCGHEHSDLIGLVNATSRQVILLSTLGLALYGTTNPMYANLSDMPRGGKGITQDSFNVYAIDKVNKMIRIARVGSNVTAELKDRKTLIIPYMTND